MNNPMTNTDPTGMVHVIQELDFESNEQWQSLTGGGGGTAGAPGGSIVATEEGAIVRGSNSAPRGTQSTTKISESAPQAKQPVRGQIGGVAPKVNPHAQGLNPKTPQAYKDVKPTRPESAGKDEKTQAKDAQAKAPNPTPDGDQGYDTTAKISPSKYPESAAHAKDAQNAGQPDVVTINRPNADANRANAQAGTAKVEGKDMDEYPPAMFEEGGTGASVRPVKPSDNRGAGASLGNQLRKFPDGTRVKIIIGDD